MVRLFELQPMLERGLSGPKWQKKCGSHCRSWHDQERCLPAVARLGEVSAGGGEMNKVD
ncbi:hypothetical protein HanXRQr2_Chr01g0021861 [Helianthus annuus]|uniref:Uncharacterized protein n=1 Tax=Helianthus annuus TaxID=4232 RepID=A0A251TUR9_HELAN|nr:hypothetical protein HanXRQr2_Chr01g0021861 [Helianthus annuus]KAJ0951635.1 hypothetical protein HanPSC8_Chr02g0062521 [Helianthus annuus]